MLELEQNWKNYRTMINDHLAIISVNMDIFTDFPVSYLNKVAHFSQFYGADKDGLPKLEEQESMFRNIIKALSQLGALKHVLYAGHIISNGEVKLYFYIEDKELFIETAQQFVASNKIDIQDDPDWDIYFDFLLPSHLEMKFSLTEEMLDSMVDNGFDLSRYYVIEHRFHFNDRDEMENFVEKCRYLDLSFISIKYTDSPLQLEDMDNNAYLLKIEQELQLDNQDIFKIVEQFEELIQYYSAEYIGWESINFPADKKYLN